MSHTCHAAKCTTNCKPEYLMCPKHWRRVPRKTQQLVWKYYQDGQCELEPAPSEKWHAAADLAIAQVAEKEGFLSSDGMQKVIDMVRPILTSKSG